MANTERSYVREIIEARKEYLRELQERDNDAYLRTILNKFNLNVSRLLEREEERPAPRLTARSILEARPAAAPTVNPSNVRQQSDNAVQTKLLAAARQQVTGQEAVLTQSRAAATAAKSGQTNLIDHILTANADRKIDAIRTNGSLTSLLLQLKNINKTLKQTAGRNNGRGFGLDLDNEHHGRDNGSRGSRNERSSGRGRGRGRNGRGSIRPPRETEPEVRSLGGRAASFAGKHAGKLVAGVAAAGGLYEIGSALASDEPINKAEIAKEGATAVGGIAGGMGGEELGAIIGTFLLPGLGTVIGGAVGGLAGGALGSELASNLGDAVGDAVSGSGIEDSISKAVEFATTPVSAESLKDLVDTYKNKIAPVLGEPVNELKTTMAGWSEETAELGRTIGNYSDAIEDGASSIFKSVLQGTQTLMDGVEDAASGAWAGVKSAVGQVKSAYNSGGVTGAAKQIGSSAIDIAGSAGAKLVSAGKHAYGQVAEGVESAGSSLNYASKKGSKSALDLAMGFSASKGFKGLSDSESKAYAGNVMQTESGGKLDIENQYGFAGQYQFGADALAENGLVDKERLTKAKKLAGAAWYTGGKHKEFLADDSNWMNPGGRKDFLSNKKLQDETFVKYTNKNIEAGYKSGALNAKSSSSDIAAYAKAAHLKGSGGANSYFLNGKDSADANGTRVSDYANGAAKSMVALASQVDKEKAVTGTTSDKQEGDFFKVEAKNKAALGLASNDVQGDFFQTEAKNKAALGLASNDVQGDFFQTEARNKAVTGTTSDKQEGDFFQTEARNKAVTGTSIPAQEGDFFKVETQNKDALGLASNVTPSLASLDVPSSRRTVSGQPVYSTTELDTATPVAEGKATPIAMASSQLPSESQNVVVTNPTPQAAPSQNINVASSGTGNASVDLNDVPIRIDDFGLILLQIGHL